MDRSIWLSLMALGLGMALLLTGRAVMDGVDYLRGVSLAAEVQSLEGAPSTKELADRVTEAAGCIYGDRPRVHTCWYAWAHPERPEFLAIIAERVKTDSGGSALGYLLASLPFWVLALLSSWKATRRRELFRPSLMAPPPPVEPTRPHGRMVP